MHELIRRRPDPKTASKLLTAIATDDGKGTDGEWLCQRLGFTGELPKWMPDFRRTAGRPPTKNAKKSAKTQPELAEA
jgi:hypothetical protein